eukprot:8601658-Pyramimonas_sp.AAC.1
MGSCGVGEVPEVKSHLRDMWHRCDKDFTAAGAVLKARKTMWHRGRATKIAHPSRGPRDANGVSASGGGSGQPFQSARQWQPLAQPPSLSVFSFSSSPLLVLLILLLLHSLPRAETPPSRSSVPRQGAASAWFGVGQAGDDD